MYLRIAVDFVHVIYGSRPFRRKEQAWENDRELHDLTGICRMHFVVPPSFPIDAGRRCGGWASHSRFCFDDVDEGRFAAVAGLVSR